MRLSELVAYQKRWEGVRGIQNQNHNIDRIQVELDEAREEPNPYKRLIELIDVAIITAGGMYKLCDELGIPYSDVDFLLREKLQVNELKYNPKYFEGVTPEQGQLLARYYWALEQPEMGTPNDVY